MAEQRDFNSQVYESLIELSGQAIKYAFLANAGAIVAMLAFLGEIWGDAGGLDPARINATIRWFVFGLLAAMFTSFFAYLTQLRVYQESVHGARKNVHSLILGAAFVSLIASIVLFSVGALSSASILVKGATWDSGVTWDSDAVWP